MKNIYKKHDILQVLSEFVGGGSATQYMHRQQPVDLSNLHKCTTQTLRALAYLHSKSITHKDLRVSVVFIEEIFSNDAAFTYNCILVEVHVCILVWLRLLLQFSSLLLDSTGCVRLAEYSISKK